MDTTVKKQPGTLTVEEAVQDLRAGKMILLSDDATRENETDLCIAAQFTTPEAINFMAHHGGGLICAALSSQNVDHLKLPMADQIGTVLQGTAFTVSVDLKAGLTTGIPAAERAATIRALVDPNTTLADFVSPGHVFPLRARQEGTLARRGHTEASIDLMRIAGLEAGAAICEVLGERGDMLRGDEIAGFASTWDLGILTVEDIVSYRKQHSVSLVSETQLPTQDAVFKLQDYQEIATGQHYLALILGDLKASDEAPLLRLHSACATGDIFGSQRCDCQAQLHASMRAIAAEDRGVILYLPQEGRGIGLTGKLQAYALQDQGLDTVDANLHLGYPADARVYDAAVEVLHVLGVDQARLLTNNPKKIDALEHAGIEIERVPLEMVPSVTNVRYLQTKRRRLGHLLDLDTNVAVKEEEEIYEPAARS